MKSDALTRLLAEVEPDEAVKAQGLAVREPVIVTDRRIVVLRLASVGPVSIPLDAVTSVESRRDAHRWQIKLLHERVDPRSRPSDATQWWRWHDRRRDRRRAERSRHETVLAFSREHTSAADAIVDSLAERRVPVYELP